jgi:LAO/AO transport system kinase
LSFLCAIKVETNPALIEGIRSGDKKVLARAITIVENEMPGADDLLRSTIVNDVPVIGITGPPGAGKSSLINSFLRYLSSQNKKVAVVAVDPTSPFNYGSLLADRLRMSEHFNNENVFIRSVATRGSLGGLSEKIIEITDVLKSSYFDYILIETVGVGQSEVEIAGLADTTVVVLVPESGDDIQAMKSGIMEIADIFIVNKSDREGASAMTMNLKNMLSGRMQSDWHVPVINTIAVSGEGIPELFTQISKHRQSDRFNEKKMYLLAEKAYQLIRNHRMKNLSRKDIKNHLSEVYSNKNFNLYKFVDQIIN